MNPLRNAATTLSLWSPLAPAPRSGADTERTEGSDFVKLPSATPTCSIASVVEEFRRTEAIYGEILFFD